MPSLLALAAAFWLAGCQAAVPVEWVWVEVPAGAPMSQVADSLAAYGVVGSAGAFERYTRRRHRYWAAEPGVYRLRRGMSPSQVVWNLRRLAPMARVVVRERMTVAELAHELERGLDIPPESVLAAARDSALTARVGAPQSVEGYLYPTTYYVGRKVPPTGILRQMVDTFETRWNPAWNQRLATLGMSRHELVTLASIVAGEMPHEEEVFDIASVYHNRLRRGMRLQADPTVVYALGERRRLTFKDYRIASEYNTYRIPGLPPGPIGQPSTATLAATLYPSESEYLFFVGSGNGRHEFSRTYREHLRTIAAVRGRVE